jgi:hypothetical protein
MTASLRVHSVGFALYSAALECAVLLALIPGECVRIACGRSTRHHLRERLGRGRKLAATGGRGRKLALAVASSRGQAGTGGQTCR